MYIVVRFQILLKMFCFRWQIHIETDGSWVCFSRVSQENWTITNQSGAKSYLGGTEGREGANVIPWICNVDPILSFNVYCYTLAPIKLNHLNSRECSVQHTSNISWVWILHWASWGAARSLSGPWGIKLCQLTLFCCRGNGYKWSLSWWLVCVTVCSIVVTFMRYFGLRIVHPLHTYIKYRNRLFHKLTLFFLTKLNLMQYSFLHIQPSHISYSSPYCYKYKLQSKHCLTSIIILTWGKLTNSQRKD